MQNTLYITWESKYNLGIKIIDEQHRGIVTTINSFFYYSSAGKGLEIIKPTITVLKQYISIHFKTEEALMKDAAYPAIKKHILLHEKLIYKTKSISREAAILKDTDIFLQLLKDWWLNHINEEDKKYAPYLMKMIIA